MNVNATGNAGYYPITDAITSYLKNKGPSSEACLTPEVVQNLQNLEIRVRRDGLRDHFDTVEIIGNPPERHDMIDEECVNTLGISRLGMDRSRLTTTFTSEQVSERAVALSWLMEDRDPFDAINGFASLDVSDEELAQHLGKIGRRIDECFAAGEITQQEYDDLNAGLEKYTGAMIVRCERASALKVLRSEHAKVYNAMEKNGASQKELEAYAKQFSDSLEDNIKNLVKKYFAIDRNLIAKLVQQVRSGEDLNSDSSRQTNGKDKTVGYSNGYGPFVPAQNE